MDKKHIFEHFPISILKKIIRTYNLHVKISGYSKMTQSELVMELKKHLIIGDDGSMKVKEVKDVGMIHDYEKKKKVSVKDNKSKGLKKEKKIKESKPEVKKQIKEVKSEPVKEEPKINKEELIKHFREKLNFKEKRIPGRDLSRYIKRIYETYTKDEQKILEEFYIKLIHNEKIDSYHNFRPKIGVFTNYEHKIDELEKRIKAMKDTEYKTKKAKENNEKKIDELEKELKPLKHSNKITNKYIKCIEDSYEKMQNMKDIKTINDVNEYIKLVDIRFRCELHFDEKEEESKPEPKPEEKKKEPNTELKMPLPSTPAKEKKLHDRLLNLKKMGHEKVVIYKGDPMSSSLFHLNFLHKHKYNCIIEPYKFHGLSKEYENYFINQIVPKITKCVKNGSKIIAIPIGFSNHFNMLIYNVELNELYRFEPHGEKYEKEESLFGYKDIPDEKLNTILINFVNNEMVIKEFGEIKYLSPVETCPRIKKSVRAGFQAMENYYLQIILSEKEMEKLNKKEGGFCQAWSWFILDLIIMNPKKSINDIYKEAHKALENDPYAFRSVIRGFILEVQSELLNINKDLSFEKIASEDIQSRNKIFNFYENEIKRLSNYTPK